MFNRLLELIILSGSCLLVYQYKIIGLLISIIALLLGGALYYTDNYSPEKIIKIYLITATTTLFFYKLNFKKGPNVNYILTFLLFMNVLVLLFTVIPNPFIKHYITNNVLAVGLLLVTLSTPFVKVANGKASLTKIFTNVNMYIILYTITIIYYFMSIPISKNNLYLNILCLILPLLSHFSNNKWPETRATCLCMFILYEIFNENITIPLNLKKFFE